MERDNGSLLAAFSTVLPLDGPATPPCANPANDEVLQPRDEAEAPAPAGGDDEAITGAGGAYM